ncbi:MAG TPA: glycosyltransferase family A protein [Longimicrobiales bacterium]
MSCLTATKDRLAHLRGAIRCYLDQTYEPREMVIATDGSPWFRGAVRRHLAELDRDDIRLVELDEGEGLTLGAVRNRLLDAARGEILCQWDDDDLSHPRRLAAQVAHLQAEGADACVLNDQLHFFQESRELVWVDWANGPWEGMLRAIPGTLLMRAGLGVRYPEEGPHARAGEDSALLADVWARGSVAELRGAGDLSVYTFHGGNTFDEAHHRGISRDRVAALDATPELEARLRDTLSYYTLAYPLAVRVNALGTFFAYGGPGHEG